MKFMIGWVMKKIVPKMTARLKKPLRSDLFSMDWSLSGSRWDTAEGKVKGLGGRLGYFQSSFIICRSDINLYFINYPQIQVSYLTTSKIGIIRQRYITNDIGILLPLRTLPSLTKVPTRSIHY